MSIVEVYDSASMARHQNMMAENPKKVLKSKFIPSVLRKDKFIITESLETEGLLFGPIFKLKGGVYAVEFQVNTPSSVGSTVDLLVYDGNTADSNFLFSLVENIDTAVAGTVIGLDNFSERRFLPGGSYIALKNTGAAISDGEFGFSLIYTMNE